MCSQCVLVCCQCFHMFFTIFIHMLSVFPHVFHNIHSYVVSVSTCVINVSIFFTIVAGETISKFLKEINLYTKIYFTPGF